MDEIVKNEINIIDLIFGNGALHRFATGTRNFSESVRRQLTEFQGSDLAKTIRDGLPLIAAATSRFGANEEFLKNQVLPHRTSPIHLLETHKDNPETFRAAVEQYYKENWAAVRRDLLKKSSTYNVEEETKDVFREAVNCHDRGLYRSSVRLIFPEIERLYRSTTGEAVGGTVTSQHDVRRLSNALSDRMEPTLGFESYQLAKALDKHMYEKVLDDVALKKFSDNAIPNRHAAIHGNITYKSALNSFNTIIMLEYVMAIYDIWHRESIKQDFSPIVD